MPEVGTVRLDRETKLRDARADQSGQCNQCANAMDQGHRAERKGGREATGNRQHRWGGYHHHPGSGAREAAPTTHPTPPIHYYHSTVRSSIHPYLHPPAPLSPLALYPLCAQRRRRRRHHVKPQPAEEMMYLFSYSFCPSSATAAFDRSRCFYCSLSIFHHHHHHRRRLSPLI